MASTDVKSKEKTQVVEQPSHSTMSWKQTIIGFGLLCALLGVVARLSHAQGQTAATDLALAKKAAAAVELTQEDWDEKTAGKSVFVKFYAPWCGHCKSMKPDWDKLMMEYNGGKDILIADVDCIGGGKSLCDSVGTEGFPTIKYGDPHNLEAYKGGRDFKTLQQFVKDNLGPTCGPANLDLCDADKKDQINKFMAMSVEDLKKTIEEKDSESAKLEKEFEGFQEELQKQYEEGQKARDEKKKAIQDSGLSLMKSVEAAKKTGKGEL